MSYFGVFFCGGGHVSSIWAKRLLCWLAAQFCPIATSAPLDPPPLHTPSCTFTFTLLLPFPPSSPTVLNNEFIHSLAGDSQHCFTPIQRFDKQFNIILLVHQLDDLKTGIFGNSRTWKHGKFETWKLFVLISATFASFRHLITVLNLMAKIYLFTLNHFPQLLWNFQVTSKKYHDLSKFQNILEIKKEISQNFKNLKKTKKRNFQNWKQKIVQYFQIENGN